MSDIDSADDVGKSNDDRNDLFKHTKHASSISPSVLVSALLAYSEGPASLDVLSVVSDIAITVCYRACSWSRDCNFYVLTLKVKQERWSVWFQAFSSKQRMVCARFGSHRNR
jgi:hypothetical protein